MAELAKYKREQRQRAFQALREQFNQVPGSQEPLPLLISAALKEWNGSIHLPPDLADPSALSWDRWTWALSQDSKKVNEALFQVQEREDAEVPEDPEELPEWAAYLVVETLDQLGLVP